MRTAGVVALLAAAGIAASCGSKRDAALSAHVQSPLPCRDLIDGAGRPVLMPLRWHLAPDEADRRQLEPWCGTVGPGVLHAAHTAPSSRPGDIAVVSWNVHVGGGQLATVVREIRSGRFTGGSPPAGFVLLLQEAFRGGPAVPATIPVDAPVPDRIQPSASGTRDEVVSLAVAEGLALLYLPSMRNGRDGNARSEDRGNAILSTFDLADPIGVELPFVRQRRVAVAATVSGTGPDQQPWQLRVASVHLDAGTGPRQLWLFTSAHRERQAQHFVDRFDDDEIATVVGGDLNTWAGARREPAFLAFRREFPRAAAGAPVARLLTLDYLFFRLPPRWQTESEPADSAFGSDHRPIVGRIRLGS